MQCSCEAYRGTAKPGLPKRRRDINDIGCQNAELKPWSVNSASMRQRKPQDEMTCAERRVETRQRKSLDGDEKSRSHSGEKARKYVNEFYNTARR
jgi:hypothetical protein